MPWRQAGGYVYPEVCAPSNETKQLTAATELPWFKNGLRHSAATHLMAELGNAALVGERLGTSVGQIKANYAAVPADIDPKAYHGTMLGEAAGDGREVLRMTQRWLRTRAGRCLSAICRHRAKPDHKRLVCNAVREGFERLLAERRRGRVFAYMHFLCTNLPGRSTC